MQTEIIVVAHNIRSCYNVGSILRTSDGIGVRTVYLTGYTPYPRLKNDTRLPHIAEKLEKQINKSALGAETSQAWERHEDIQALIQSLKSDGWIIAGLEQHSSALPLNTFSSPEKIVLILGEEVEGIDANILTLCDVLLEIPMRGQKESFNVASAAAMALYQCRFH